MLQRNTVCLFALAFALLNACRSGPPIASSGVRPDRVLYQAAINTFFQDGHVQDLMRLDRLPHQRVFIRTTFGNTQTPLPVDILQMLVTQTMAHGLVQVQTEQAGSLVITISALEHDPAASTGAQHPGPTIALGVRISGISCGASIDISYLLMATERGWQAQQYMVAVC